MKQIDKVILSLRPDEKRWTRSIKHCKKIINLRYYHCIKILFLSYDIICILIKKKTAFVKCKYFIVSYRFNFVISNALSLKICIYSYVNFDATEKLLFDWYYHVCVYWVWKILYIVDNQGDENTQVITIHIMEHKANARGIIVFKLEQTC